MAVQGDSAQRNAIVWGECAETVSNKLVADKVYTISKYNTQVPNKRFNKDSVFNSSTEVNSEDEDDEFGIPKPEELAIAIHHKEKITISGRITSISSLELSPQKKMPLRKLCIVDSSRVECCVVGFKDTATKFPYTVGDCVMLTNTRSDGSQMIQGTDTDITACQREPTPE